MRIWEYLVLFVLLVVAGCYPDVQLRHDDGRMVVCEGKQGATSHILAQERCIADYKKDGFKEVR